MQIHTIRWEGDARGHAVLLDQTRLPSETAWLEVRDLETMADAIRRLCVRGAPALGVAGAYGLVLGMQAAPAEDADDFVARTREAAAWLARARPTAVNLPGALARGVRRAERDAAAGMAPDALLAGLLDEARTLEDEERDACERMGAFGAELIRDGMHVMTHCNAGALATVGIGTALAPFYVAARQKKRLHVYADETRPLFQGARLTAWELARAGLDVTVLSDNAAGALLARGGIGAVFVGADRIARNGDVANKIGTYPLAVLARRHGVPFYVVAPCSTLDPRCPTGAEIPIEQRDAREVTHPLGTQATPDGVGAFNPAFDVTPAELVSALVCERGVVHHPDEARLAALFERPGPADTEEPARG
jgi:methylthioribose-1-phosphate isomerase